MKNIVNGYEISGNVAKQGREYHVFDDRGNTLHTTDHKQKAEAWAREQSTGKCKAPDPEPTSSKPDLTEDQAAAKMKKSEAAKKRAAKKAEKSDKESVA